MSRRKVKRKPSRPRARTTVIMLAGSIEPPPLREATGLPIPCLPLTANATLLETWLACIEQTLPESEVRIIVNSEPDAELIAAVLSRKRRGRTGRAARRVLVEPAAWRGTAGLLRDVSADLASEERIISIEAGALPPKSLQPLIDAMDARSTGVVGASAMGEPNGLMLFEVSALGAVGSIGYLDVKEQLLPALNSRGRRVRPARFDDLVLRIRDRRSYLSAVRLNVAPAERDGGEAGLFGHCIIADSAVIEEGAVVHDSVVLGGAVIRQGAVVTRSVVASGAVVEANTKVVRQLVGQPTSGEFAGAKDMPRRQRA